jgi:outer membrane protein OmpA-like peptidoglycan-associated protein
MSSQNDDNQGAGLVVVAAVVAAVVVGVVTLGAFKASPGAPAAQPVVAVAMDAAADGASVKVENGVVKFYFASGKADLATGAQAALADVVAAAAAGKSLAVSGFHDATGDAAQNAELAKQRALAVRDALQALGVAPEKIELKKPEETLATGANAEARRVEVSVL